MQGNWHIYGPPSVCWRSNPRSIPLGSGWSVSASAGEAFDPRRPDTLVIGQEGREAEMSTVIGLDAVGAAALADALLVDGEPLQVVWRHCIVQLLDDYSRDLARAGVAVASRRFDVEPPSTRSAAVDAALAALAEHLARRDGWTPPPWARKPGRYSPRWWFVTPLRGMHPTALQESPPSFRTRGVFITAGALSRV